MPIKVYQWRVKSAEKVVLFVRVESQSNLVPRIAKIEAHVITNRRIKYNFWDWERDFSLNREGYTKLKDGIIIIEIDVEREGKGN